MVVHTELNIGPLIQHLLSQLAVLWWVFPHCYFQFSSVTVPHFFHFNLDLLKMQINKKVAQLCVYFYFWDLTFHAIYTSCKVCVIDFF